MSYFREFGLKKFRKILFVFVLSLSLSSFLPSFPFFVIPLPFAAIPLSASQPKNFANYAELSSLKFITRPA